LLCNGCDVVLLSEVAREGSLAIQKSTRSLAGGGQVPDEKHIGRSWAIQITAQQHTRSGRKVMSRIYVTPPLQIPEQRIKAFKRRERMAGLGTQHRNRGIEVMEKRPLEREPREPRGQRGQGHRQGFIPQGRLCPRYHSPPASPTAEEAIAGAGSKGCRAYFWRVTSGCSRSRYGLRRERMLRNLGVLLPGLALLRWSS